MTNYNQLTYREAGRRGWTIGLVERYVHQTRRRHDLFGFLDFVALEPAGQTVGLQVTRWEIMAHRYRKIEQAPTLQAVVRAGWRIEVWGWKKPDHRWMLKRAVLEPADLTWRIVESGVPDRASEAPVGP